MNATFFRTKLKNEDISFAHNSVLRENAHVKTVYVKNVCKNISHGQFLEIWFGIRDWLPKAGQSWYGPNSYIIDKIMMFFKNFSQLEITILHLYPFASRPSIDYITELRMIHTYDRKILIEQSKIIPLSYISIGQKYNIIRCHVIVCHSNNCGVYVKSQVIWDVKR